MSVEDDEWLSNDLQDLEIDPVIDESLKLIGIPLGLSRVVLHCRSQLVE